MSARTLTKQIDEQKKLINYLQEKYKNDTGSEVLLPQTWTQFLGVNQENAPIKDLQLPEISKEVYIMEKKFEYDSFLHALADLNLPLRKADLKKKIGSKPESNRSSTDKLKKQITTSFDPANPDHMIEKINLSNFIGMVLNHSIIIMKLRLQYRNLVSLV